MGGGDGEGTVGESGVGAAAGQDRCPVFSCWFSGGRRWSCEDSSGALGPPWATQRSRSQAAEKLAQGKPPRPVSLDSSRCVCLALKPTLLGPSSGREQKPQVWLLACPAEPCPAEPTALGSCQTPRSIPCQPVTSFQVPFSTKAKREHSSPPDCDGPPCTQRQARIFFPPTDICSLLCAPSTDVAPARMLPHSQGRRRASPSLPFPLSHS